MSFNEDSKTVVYKGEHFHPTALEDTIVPDCSNCETVDVECCCGGTADGCTEDCDTCDECDCDCEEDCTCDTECDYCTCEEDDDEEVYHCGGCH